MYSFSIILLTLVGTFTATGAWTNSKISNLGMTSTSQQTVLFESVSGVGNAPSFYTVIGGGRIGTLLHQEGKSLLLKRGDKIPGDNEGTPIFIATRNDSLDGIIAECPENRLKDLVFLQNGYLDAYLSEKGLADNTQCLLYLSVPKVGVDPVDGITSVNPEGLTAATGVHAQALSDVLASLHLKCNVVSMDEYQPAMFEKLM